LEPYVLMDDASALSRTIIEKLEEETQKCKFAIVLLTPDDIGYAKEEGQEAAKPRARQNVVLEMGMLMGKLGRKHVAILRKLDTERPSDIEGIIYIEFKDSVEDAKERLRQHIKSAGIKIKD